MAKMTDMHEAIRPLRLLAISGEVIHEVSRAREKHGPNAHLADGTGPGETLIRDLRNEGNLDIGAEDDGGINYWPSNYELELAAQQANDQHRETPTTRLMVLLEEAFEAGAAVDATDLRAELIQVAAMAIDWIADLDDRLRAL